MAVIKQVVRLAATLAVAYVAGVLTVALWRAYEIAPWTRDGRVRVEVVDIAPEVSGTIVKIHVVENQFIHKGDVLFELDPVRFRLAVAQAQATAEARRQDMILRTADAHRRRNLEGAVSAEEAERYRLNAAIAAASYMEALAALDVAKLNLVRSKLYAPANGYPTNMRLRVGDYATAGEPQVSMVDSDSFWIYGYFEETQFRHIHVGDPARLDLMGFHDALTGHVESFARGINDRNGQSDRQGLQDINPIFTWVRLAQRIPVRIHIDSIPDGVQLVAGMTCTVTVGPQAAKARGVADRVLSWLRENI
jgi:multidrug resistance efflux pump